jgi:hypothetical protein
LLTIRKSLGHLPASWQDQVLQAVIAKAERDELSVALQRIYVIEGDSRLELEFWFEGCTDSEASQCVAASIRDSAAAGVDRPADTPSMSAMSD